MKPNLPFPTDHSYVQTTLNASELIQTLHQLFESSGTRITCLSVVELKVVYNLACRRQKMLRYRATVKRKDCH